MIIIKFSIGLIFLCLSNITDVREYKIKNNLILITLLTGMILNCVTHTVLDSVWGAMIPLVLFPLFALKMLGAGDIKAFCAIGSIVGMQLGVYTMVFSFLAGGMIAMIFMLARKNARKRFKFFIDYMKNCFLHRKLLPYHQFEDSTGYFRFSFGITGGFLMMVLGFYLGMI